MFQKQSGDWTQFRALGTFQEVDFHDSDLGLQYWERMEYVWDTAREALQDAYAQGLEYVIFTHGWSTSQLGKTTSRSQVRKLMRSKEATPYIIRRECIQHRSVFVAAIRPLPH